VFVLWRRRGLLGGYILEPREGIYKQCH
jgi:hypothetical protein